MDTGDFGGFDFFGGDVSGRHRPTTEGERTVILWLARFAALCLTLVGFGGAVFITDPERFHAFLAIGSLGVAGLIVIWTARRLGLI